MKEASLFLKAGDTPFLSNNALQGRAPSLSFYTQTVHQSGGEWLGHESEHEFGHWHYLLKPELNHPGRGKGVREDPQPPKAKNHPQPAHAALPTRHCWTQEFWLQNFCKPESPASVPHSCPAYPQPILTLLKTEHITQLQLPEDFAACLSHARALHHFLQKISLVLVALKIIAQQQIQFLTLIYIS